MKKLLSILLALAMVAGVVSAGAVSVSAEGDELVATQIAIVGTEEAEIEDDLYIVDNIDNIIYDWYWWVSGVVVAILVPPITLLYCVPIVAPFLLILAGLFAVVVIFEGRMPVWVEAVIAIVMGIVTGMLVLVLGWCGINVVASIPMGIAGGAFLTFLPNILALFDIYLYPQHASK